MTDLVADLAERVDRLLAEHPPQETDRWDFLRARYDAGLAWVHYPEGLGGLGRESAHQQAVDARLAAAGAPDNRPAGNVIGLGMAAPVIRTYATAEQQQSWLRPLWTGEEIWCQLFSEPGAGSDLAAAGASARRDGDAWVVNGQKVWTSLAHDARWALLLVRTDPTLPKHAGLSFFVLDMLTAGVDVRPLRQMTGEAEFNEVYLDDVRVPDANRLGEVGEGWRVTQATLMNERVAIGGGVGDRESGAIADVARRWRSEPSARRPELHDELLRRWIDAESLRLASARFAQKAEAGTPGPDGSGLKLAFATLAQETSSLSVALDGAEGLRYDDWSLRRPDFSNPEQRVSGFDYLRTRANSIEGGTSEVLRSIISERVLGLPAEPRVDKDIPWKDLAK
ncbi:acyl-CoA dehydrogenase family protein [Nocardioides zeae]|uniref:Acyl-CoA dehydrogenase family protein n=1 Tax=Nocardioides imazamoxiresistens TaxID=3231893 RepID=A0ABU3PSH4_9ACTN|nr:acyl-CoA dehydrogenase family protein [Nocardioides zeae]MDT9592190.1 acyl-CoA dehydrogenase family protein [Nocardioides zeae]